MKVSNEAITCNDVVRVGMTGQSSRLNDKEASRELRICGGSDSTFFLRTPVLCFLSPKQTHFPLQRGEKHAEEHNRK